MRGLNEKRNASLCVSEALGLISPLIHVGQFKIDTGRVMDPYHMDVEMEMSADVEDVAKELETNIETVKELEQVCSVENLHCDREEEIEEWDEVKLIPRDTGLATVDSWISMNRERVKEAYPTVLKSKYSEFSCVKENEKRKIKPKNESDVVKSPETILTVSVNFPRSQRRFKHCAVNFNVLGAQVTILPLYYTITSTCHINQNLCELRDVIPCALDYQPVGRFTDNPDHPRDIKCKDLYKSGFFFIENTFFDDKRSTISSELSKYILDWANFNDVALPEDLRCLSMEDHTFDDLNLRLGAPYLYRHHGDCEHILIFKDIRLIHSEDCKARSAYPLSISRARFKACVCKICDCNLATWVTRFDMLSDEDPSFFCDACFRKLHYHKDGSKVADFEAYPFIHREELSY